MQKLKEKILKEGKILHGNIVKVDSFLNHQIDVDFLSEIGNEFYKRYKDEKINKIITIEASGIAVAVETARYFGAKVVYAKKSKSSNTSDDFYKTKVMSYTHDELYTVYMSKEYLDKNDKILIIDDFLANGAALTGLIDIVNQSGAELIGCGIVIEKGFQDGGKKLRDNGIRIESLAIIDSIDVESQKIVFRGE